MFLVDVAFSEMKSLKKTLEKYLWSTETCVTQQDVRSCKKMDGDNFRELRDNTIARVEKGYISEIGDDKIRSVVNDDVRDDQNITSTPRRSACETITVGQASHSPPHTGRHQRRHAADRNLSDTSFPSSSQSLRTATRPQQQQQRTGRALKDDITSRRDRRTHTRRSTKSRQRRS